MRVLRLFPMALAWVALALAPTPAAAKVIRVPQERPTIQAAITAAKPGDTVLVSPGLYTETINFLGKRITVKSKAGPKDTIIDGGQIDSVVTFTSSEALTSVLTGFTIQGGNACEGGGINIYTASPTITNNVIKNNRGGSGSGISIIGGAPLVQGNVISNNSQSTSCSGNGGGIHINAGDSTQILDNVISDNVIGDGSGGGIFLIYAGAVTIRGNVIKGNAASGLSPCSQGGGITLLGRPNADIIGNLIVLNTARCGGGVYWLVETGARGPLLVNNTIADNNGEQGSGVFADFADSSVLLVNNIIVGRAGQAAVFCGNFGDSNPPMFQFNDVFSPTGQAYGGVCVDQTGLNGNISADPLFVGPVGVDYHLQSGSPAIDAGTNSAPLLPPVDLDGDPRILDGDGNGAAIVDMGADEFNLNAVAAVSGRFLVGGNPLVGAQVILKNTAGRGKFPTTTDDSGAYTYDPVAAGNYTLTLTRATVGATGEVSGNLRIRGQPAAGNTVKLKSLGTGTKAATKTDAGGSFSFPGIEPGSYKLSILDVTVP